VTDGATGRLALVLAVAIVTYLTRLAGFRLRLGSRGPAGETALPAPVERFLAYVPIAAFAALVAPGVAGGGGSLVARLAAVLCAAVVALRLRRLWLSIAAGLAGYWIVEAFGL
jgi:branched-subunit amino acid transport protein